MQDRLQMRVSLAVLLVDDFTDRVIMGSAAQVTAANCDGSVKKEDGYHVFINGKDPVTRVVATGAGYYREERKIPLSDLDPRHPIVWIRMKPDQSYALPQDTVRVLAFLPKATGLIMFPEGGSRYRRLLADYEKGSDEIRFYQESGETFAGKTCCIEEKSGRTEVFRLGAPKDQGLGSYVLEQPMSFSYKKADARIYLVSPVGGESEKEYFLPLHGEGGEENYTCILQQGEKQWMERVKLVFGKENRLDFRGRINPAAEP